MRWVQDPGCPRMGGGQPSFGANSLALPGLPPRAPRGWAGRPQEASQWGRGVGRLQTGLGRSGFPVAAGGPRLCPSVSLRNAATEWIKAALSGPSRRGSGEDGKGRPARKGLPLPPGGGAPAIPQLQAPGRKHLCPLDTHILCCDLPTLPELSFIASVCSSG